MDPNQTSVEEARYVILRELARQNDGRMNGRTIVQVLDVYGYNRSLEWVRTQLAKLEELGAIRVRDAGDDRIVSLTVAGLDHVERRSIIAGVARPSRAE